MHPYQLQPYSGMQSRHRCPACKHRSKSFVRYINTSTGAEIAPHVGRCSRQDKCAYHLPPATYFSELRSIHGSRLTADGKKPRATKRHEPSTINHECYYIHPEYVNNSFINYEHNNFVQYLIKRFGFNKADELVGAYRIGTSAYWHGATIFWQLDNLGYVRSGKIMLYNKETGKRVKKPFNHITWAHKVIQREFAANSVQFADGSPAITAKGPLKTENFILKQCLFGEHLLINSPYKPIAVVESEKTAIIASAMMPAFIWLAAGSMEGLNAEKCQVLNGRKVMLFPDVNAHKKWKLKAQELQRTMPGTIFAISDQLERLATDKDRKMGVDLGDVLI